MKEGTIELIKHGAWNESSFVYLTFFTGIHIQTYITVNLNTSQITISYVFDFYEAEDRKSWSYNVTIFLTTPKCMYAGDSDSLCSLYVSHINEFSCW